KAIIAEVHKPVRITVFLKGNFPSNFRRLHNETRYLLEEFSAYNRQLQFKFVNPLEQSEEDAEALGNRFFASGMPPQRLNVKKNSENSQQLIFPWAVATYGDETVKIPLLKGKRGDSNEELVNKSVQELEYAFANGLKKLTSEKSKNIAVMRGNGELSDRHIADFLKTVGAYYHTAPFTLDSVARNPQKTLQQLEKYDLIVEAKPTEAFSENE